MAVKFAKLQLKDGRGAFCAINPHAVAAILPSDSHTSDGAASCYVFLNGLNAERLHVVGSVEDAAQHLSRLSADYADEWSIS